jgi:hypothetical protein
VNINVKDLNGASCKETVKELLSADRIEDAANFLDQILLKQQDNHLKEMRSGLVAHMASNTRLDRFFLVEAVITFDKYQVEKTKIIHRLHKIAGLVCQHIAFTSHKKELLMTRDTEKRYGKSSSRTTHYEEKASHRDMIDIKNQITHNVAILESELRDIMSEIADLEGK